MNVKAKNIFEMSKIYFISDFICLMLPVRGCRGVSLKLITPRLAAVLNADEDD